MSDRRRHQDPPTAEQVEAWANAKVRTTEAEAKAQRVTRAAERADRREEREERRAEKGRVRDDRRRRREERGDAVRTWGQRAGQRMVLVMPILLVNVMALAGQSGFAAEHLDWAFPMTWVFAGAVESIAIYIGWHAHVALLAGHSVAKLRAASYGVAAVVAVMNFEHFADPTTGEPTASSFAFGMMSLLSPWLWAMHSRYVHREQLEADGLVDARAARFSGAKWLHFPFRTWGALRWSIDQGVTDPAAAWSGYALVRRRRSAAKRDRSASGAALEASGATVPDRSGHWWNRRRNGARNTAPLAPALSTRYMLAVPRWNTLPAGVIVAGQREDSGSAAGRPNDPSATPDATPEAVPDTTGTASTAVPPPAAAPLIDASGAVTVPGREPDASAPESDASGTVTRTPSDVLLGYGCTVPADPAALTSDQRTAAARQAWRDARANGHEVSGAVLGAVFGHSDRWGRTQIAAARKADESVIQLADRDQRTS